VGRWFGDRRSRRTIVVALAAGLAALVVFEALFISAGGTADPLTRDFFNPATGMLVLAILAFGVGGWVTGSTRSAFLAGFAVMLVAVAGFTVMGLLRGPDWVFYWPWEAWPGGY
jgi:hypothetical protein